MNRSVKKARFICKAYKKSANAVISKTDKVEENKKQEIVKPKFFVSEGQRLMEQVRQAYKEQKPKNTIHLNTQKYETPTKRIEKTEKAEKSSGKEYEFEILSYGYVADTIITDIKEKAIKLYCKFDSSSNFAFRLYINGNLIPYKEIRNTLGVTQKHIFKYYKSY